MNYYPHHIGDYLRDTAHLTMLEDCAYRRLLDIYYANERPLPKGQAELYRLVRARSHAEKLAVDIVIGEFFSETEDGWRNKRADEEILKSKEKSESARESANTRWRHANAMRTQCEGNAPNNQKPITNNQKEEIHVGTARANGARHPKADVSELVATLPLREGGEFEIRQSLIDELEPLYPAVDIQATLREMKGWLLLNTERRKTRRGIRKFIGNWLQSEQEKHGG